MLNSVGSPCTDRRGRASTSTCRSSRSCRHWSRCLLRRCRRIRWVRYRLLNSVVDNFSLQRVPCGCSCRLRTCTPFVDICFSVMILLRVCPQDVVLVHVTYLNVYTLVSGNKTSSNTNIYKSSCRKVPKKLRGSSPSANSWLAWRSPSSSRPWGSRRRGTLRCTPSRRSSRIR